MAGAPDISLTDLQLRMTARKLLRDAYVDDVDALARAMAERVRRGDFDRAFWMAEPTLDLMIRRHPRVADEMLALETVALSPNRRAIEIDFLRGFSDEPGGPWSGFTVVIDEDSGQPVDIVLPPWNVVAEHAFGRDVRERVYALLGDSAERFIAMRMGIRYDADA